MNYSGHLSYKDKKLKINFDQQPEEYNNYDTNIKLSPIIPILLNPTSNKSTITVKS